MENMYGLSRKKIIIAAAALLVIIVFVVIANQKGAENAPIQSKVKPGQTITQQQIQQQNLDKSKASANSGTANPSPSSAPQPTPTTTDFYKLIAASNTIIPDSKGQVSFGIVKTVNQMPGWYVVTIKSGNLEPAKVIFQQSNDPNNSLVIVAGPGTDFPRETVSVPDAVRKAL